MHVTRGTYPANAGKHAGMTKAAHMGMAAVMAQVGYDAGLDNEHMIYGISDLA